MAGRATGQGARLVLEPGYQDRYLSADQSFIQFPLNARLKGQQRLQPPIGHLVRNLARQTQSGSAGSRRVSKGEDRCETHRLEQLGAAFEILLTISKDDFVPIASSIRRDRWSN